LQQLLQDAEGHRHRVADLDRRQRCLATIGPPRLLPCDSLAQTARRALIKYSFRAFPPSPAPAPAVLARAAGHRAGKAHTVWQNRTLLRAWLV
jgi:hypothetical protein